jgi:hypothetical protein
MLRPWSRSGGWERVIAWAQAQQLREMTSFMDSAQIRKGVGCLRLPSPRLSGG